MFYIIYLTFLSAFNVFNNNNDNDKKIFYKKPSHNCNLNIFSFFTVTITLHNYKGTFSWLFVRGY